MRSTRPDLLDHPLPWYWVLHTEDGDEGARTLMLAESRHYSGLQDALDTRFPALAPASDPVHPQTMQRLKLTSTVPWYLTRLSFTMIPSAFPIMLHPQEELGDRLPHHRGVRVDCER